MGVVSNNCFDCVLLNSLHVRTLMLTDVQTPFLGTPLIPFKILSAFFSPLLIRMLGSFCIYLHLYLYLYLFLYLSYLSIYLSIYLYLYISMTICLSLYISISIYTSLSRSLSISLPLLPRRAW